MQVLLAIVREGVLCKPTLSFLLCLLGLYQVFDSSIRAFSCLKSINYSKRERQLVHFELALSHMLLLREIGG